MDRSVRTKYRKTEADGGICLMCRRNAKFLNGDYYCDESHSGDLENKPTASEINRSWLAHPSNQPKN